MALYLYQEKRKKKPSPSAFMWQNKRPSLTSQVLFYCLVTAHGLPLKHNQRKSPYERERVLVKFVCVRSSERVKVIRGRRNKNFVGTKFDR